MRYYIIINGVNSLTIPGLAIRTLPPISKPAMRNLREEIDGRDGDITTELGYGAYDRPLEIGLFGDYDINKIIAFFNSKGKIIFSDEPDKYYNFEIVDKIDYTKLVKFRTATINIHCQPFKYPVSEEPQVEEYEYVEATGTNVTLDNTSEAIFNKIDLKGNTSQAGTPTPDTPIPVNVVSGDNTINVCGKNLFKPFNYSVTSNGIAFSYDNTGSISFNGTATNNAFSLSSTNAFANGYYVILQAGSYCLSGGLNQEGVQLRAINVENGASLISTMTQGNFTISAPTKVAIIVRIASGTTANGNIYPMLEVGTTNSDYEPYIGKSYPIYLGVENLFDNTKTNDTQRNNAYSLNVSGNNITYGTTSSGVNSGIAWYIPVENGEIYTISYSDLVETTTNNNNRVEYLFSDSVLSTWTWGTDINKTNKYATTTATANYLVLILRAGTSYTISDLQVETGSKINHPSSTPIELCKIGDYQDYIYKDNGKWWLYKAIGKVVLDGSESWEIYNTGTNNWYYYATISSIDIGSDSTALNSLCDHYPFGAVGNSNTNNGYYIVKNQKNIRIRYGTEDTIANYKSWLSSNNVAVYYVLSTPTTTEITDTTLISQLEAIKNAVSYSGQTNVSQINNDLSFILDLSALKEGSDHLVINNSGNIYAKPTMDLEGTGVVGIYLNDVQILEADLTENNNIVIDTESMEAYNPDTNALANRQVTGDYSKIKLEPGENDLRFSGDLSKATVTKYKRWL